MKIMAMLFSSIFGVILSVEAQSKYLSDILTNKDGNKNGGYSVISINYWRYDSCLDSKQMCKYNTSMGLNVKISQNRENVLCELLRGNNSGYQSRNPYDTFVYSFSPYNINKSTLERKLLIKDTYVRADTFNLMAIDTLLYTNYSLLKKVFGKSEMKEQKPLRIYVLKSVDEFGSSILNFWVDRIGIVKIADEKCWRYSFEMNDDRNKSLGKMIAGIMKVIKTKYNDPYWLGEPCGIEKN